MRCNIRARPLVALASLWLGMLIVVGCGGGGGAPSRTVEGYVVDAQSGAPVQNGYVYVPTGAITSQPRSGRQVQLETYTDAQGHFGFANFPAELAVVVVVEPPGGFDPTPVRLSYGQTLGQLGTMHLRVSVRLLAADLVSNLTDIIITPNSSTVGPGDTVNFSAELAWSGVPPATLPKVTWSTEGGVGLIDADGAFTAGSVGADGYVVATLGSVVRRAHVVVQSGTPPQLSVAPTSLDFGSSDTQKTVTVTNTGGGTLLWSIWPLGDPVAWLSFTPRSGSLEPAQDATVQLAVSRTGLGPGVYTTTLRVGSNGGYADVTITMTVVSGPAGRIAFASNRVWDWEVYVMNADGSGQTNLSQNAGYDSAPMWSPDGTKLAFVSNRDGNLQVYVMNADGSGQTNLSQNAGYDYAPVWSPDGTKLAFFSDRDGNWEVYVMNADGSGQTNLSQNAGRDQDPVWSPDGTKLAFGSDRDGNYEVYVMNPDGSGQTNLSQNAGYDYDPVWSPDGTKLAFVSGRDGNREVYVMNADGSGQTNLSQNPTNDDGAPDWRP